MSHLDPLINALLETKEPPLIFPPPGDFHSSNTAAFFGHDAMKKAYIEDPKTFKHKFRGTGKVAGLALVYGSSWKMFLDMIDNCTEQQAKEIYNSFFNNLPVFKAYDKRNIKAAQKHEYVHTFIKRRLYIDIINSDKWGLRAKGERNAKNSPIQGAGSEIIKYLLLKLFNYIDEHKLSRWVGTYLYSNYYTRILAIQQSDVKEDLESDLDGQKNGNCLILILDGDKVASEFDRPVQMTQELVTKHNLEIIL